MYWELTGAPGHSTENPNSQPRSIAFESCDQLEHILCSRFLLLVQIPRKLCECPGV